MSAIPSSTETIPASKPIDVGCYFDDAGRGLRWYRELGQRIDRSCCARLSPLSPQPLAPLYKLPTCNLMRKMKFGGSGASWDRVKQHITDLCLRWSGIECVGLCQMFRRRTFPPTTKVIEGRGSFFRPNI